ncbi:Maltose/galactoside acetyltransferase domain-containing protein [Entamoeba marina]
MQQQFNEEELMLSGKLYDSTVPSLQKKRDEYFNDERSKEKRDEILKSLLCHIGNNVTITPPFHCDYGCYISVGDNTYINTNCTALDPNYITIGKDVMIGPNVQLLAATHPTDPVIRRSLVEYGIKITIKDGVWIGARSTVLPGVTIGKNSVIGAGSVVTKDIPDDVVACGNPCRVMRKATQQKSEETK